MPLFEIQGYFGVSLAAASFNRDLIEIALRDWMFGRPRAYDAQEPKFKEKPPIQRHIDLDCGNDCIFPCDAWHFGNFFDSITGSIEGHFARC